MRNGKTGFSLIEMLITVGILAALMGLAMPYYRDYIGESRRSVMKANFFALRKAVMEYHADTGKYPADANALIVLTQPPNRYLLELPIDPEPTTPTEPVPATWGYRLENAVPVWGAKYTALTQQ
jgi:general secretion pathway protein G